jgi:L-iditol 2-dehydrogenase
MKALVYQGPGRVELEERPIPEPREDEVLIKLNAVSVCGSDLGAYRLKEVSDRWAPPIVLGHEFSGEIAGYGKNATRSKIGARVTANPILYCGKCFYCSRGDINLCANRHSFGTSIGGEATDGALQEYFTIRESAIIELDPRVGYEAGALLEPLAVCYNAARKGCEGNGASERVAVMGAGPIGLMTIKFLKAMGASEIVASDIVDKKLEYAKKYGATRTVNALKGSFKDAVMEATGGVGADRVIICGGNAQAIPDALGMVRNGGNVVLVALAHYHVGLEPMQLVSRGVSLLGSYMFRWEQRDAMRMVAEGAIDVGDLITSRWKLEDGPDLFRRLASPDSEEVKVLITS